MMFYKPVKLGKGVVVQFVGVSPLAWNPTWGKPKIGFVKIESPRQKKLIRLVELRAMVSAYRYHIHNLNIEMADEVWGRIKKALDELDQMDIER